MKRMACIATLSVIVVLVFAVIASAQDSPDQSTSDPNSTNQAQSPAPSEQTTPSEQATPTQETPTVRILANAFDPPHLNVASGMPITFVNEDTVPHTVSLDGLFDTSEISPGYSLPVTLSGSGTVTYHDEANPNMRGTITVGEAGQGEAATPEESAGESTQTTDDSTQTSDAPAQMNGST